jgi:hypothetical protein
VKKRLEALKRKEKRFIVGIETGVSRGKLGAALVEVSGSGDATVLYLRGFKSMTLNSDLVSAIDALGREESFDSEVLAGINFLVLHNLTKLYQDVLENAGVPAEDVDCIGLSCLEIGQFAFPGDPAVFSELTNHIVASRFRIGVENGDGGFLSVEEELLQGIVSEMVDRFGLDEEVREAVTVALLANESIFNEGVSVCEATDAGKGKGRKILRSVKRTGPPGAADRPCLCGEFFFPA